MLALLQRLFNCDEKASRTEFYTYFIISLIPLLIVYLNTYFEFDDTLSCVLCVISILIFCCAIFRRAKGRGMNNGKITNYITQISILLMTGLLFYILNQF